MMMMMMMMMMMIFHPYIYVRELSSLFWARPLGHGGKEEAKWSPSSFSVTHTDAFHHLDSSLSPLLKVCLFYNPERYAPERSMYIDRQCRSMYCKYQTPEQKSVLEQAWQPDGGSEQEQFGGGARRRQNCSASAKITMLKRDVHERTTKGQHVLPNTLVLGSSTACFYSYFPCICSGKKNNEHGMRMQGSKDKEKTSKNKNQKQNKTEEH